MTRHRVRDWLDRLLPVGALLVITTFALSAWTVTSLGKRADENRRALQAGCARQEHSKHEIEQAEDFLAQFPDGLPGIPVAVIRRSINEDKALVALLAPILRCEEVDLP